MQKNKAYEHELISQHLSLPNAELLGWCRMMHWFGEPGRIPHLTEILGFWGTPSSLTPSAIGARTTHPPHLTGTDGDAGADVRVWPASLERQRGLILDSAMRCGVWSILPRARSKRRKWSRLLSGQSLNTQSGFPGGSTIRNLSANAGNAGDSGLIPGSGRSFGGGNGNPLQYSCLEHSMDRGTWWAILYCVAKS